MRLWDGKCTVKQLKSKCTDQREDTSPYTKPKKSPVLMMKQKGKETTKMQTPHHHDVRPSGSGV